MAQVNRPATLAGVRVLISRRQSEEAVDPPLTLQVLLQGQPKPFAGVVEAKGYGPIPRRHELPPQNLTLSLLPTTQKPFSPESLMRMNSDRFLLRQDLYAPENLTLSLLPTTQKPVKPFEWPMAPPRIMGRVADAVQNLLTSTLAAVPLAPLKAAEWSRPLFAPSRASEQALNLLLTTLKYGPFPTTGILDHFDRANEDPLANGTWALRQSGLDPLRLVSNTMRANAASGQGNSYWTQFQSGPDCEWYGTVNGLPGNGFSINAYLRMTGMGGAFGSQTGYTVLFVGSATSTNLQCIVRRRDGGTSTDLFTQAIVATTFAPGDGIGVSMRGDVLRVWYRPGAGSWTPVVTVADATYSAAGYLAADIVDSAGTPTIIVDDIGGGDPRLFPFTNALIEVAARSRMASMRDWDTDPNLSLTTLAPAVGPKPFAPTEWGWSLVPNQPRVAEPSHNRLVDLLPLTPAPFVPEEYAPAQRGSWRASEVASNPLLALLTAPQAPQPFENMEWSKPLVSPIVRSAHADPLNLSLYLRPMPFVAQEWMVCPIRRATCLSESYTNYVLKTLPQPKPFLNYDWVASAKTRTRYAPHQDANLSLSVLFGLNPVGEPYWESTVGDRPFAFEAKTRALQFPAKARKFLME